MSVGADILAALQTRLSGISTGAGYATDVKSVIINNSQMGMATGETDLPLIEIKDDVEVYEHEASSSYWANTFMLLFLVGPAGWPDSSFQNLMADVRKALFGAGPSATGNTGLPLTPRCNSIELVDAASDLNLVNSNRMYLMRIRVRSHRITYRD